MRHVILAAALALSLAACATKTVYGPQLKPGGIGYRETAIEADRYRVTFQAGSGVDAAQASDYALLRAAELTLQRGYDWFVVDGRSGDQARGGDSPRVSIGTGIGSWGGNTGVSIGTGIGFPVGGGKGGAASLDIRLGKGPKPPEGYDARSVQQSLRARL